MNESEKNIETCLPESILAEVASVPTDPQFVSLVNESLDPLKQQAVQQAGSDAYNEVVASHQPYTFTSQVAQMKSNLILLLRRFWRFPFGSGTIRSLSDMWQHYITRLQGSETYGIPSRLDQLTDLPSAPLLVADRKIGGVPEAEDGMSMVRILCDSAYAATITELTDDTTGWTMNKALTNALPNITKITLNCKKLLLNAGVRFTTLPLEELNFPEMEEMSVGTSTSTKGVFMGLQTKVLHFPVLSYMHNKELYAGVGSYSVITENPLLEEIIVGDETDGMLIEHDSAYGAGFITGESDSLPNLKYIYINAAKIRPPRQAFTPHLIHSIPATKVRFGTLTECSNFLFSGTSPNIIDLEFGQGTSCSLYLANWNPTNALDASRTDLIEEGSTAANNLEQFLSNFRSFIVLRLANRKTTTALTLTLSANVYNAVTGANSGWASQHTLAELGITSATIYATWLDTYTGANGIHWDINKAN